jgi:ribosomal protein S18 acetylase RimI-like enzyme
MLSLTASSITLRLAADTDWEDLAEMYNDFDFLPGDRGSESLWLPPASANRREHWLKNLKTGISLVAVDGDRVSGHLVMVPKGVLAETAVFVHPDYRRQGVATELLQAAMVEARRHNLTSLWVVVESENYAALQGFQKAGFHTVWEKDGEQQLVLKL